MNSDKKVYFNIIPVPTGIVLSKRDKKKIAKDLTVILKVASALFVALFSFFYLLSA